MTDTSRGALDLLEQLRQERNELDILIRGLEKRLGIVSEPESADSGNPVAKVSVSLSSIPVGFFHNMSQADAADKLLRLNEGHPLTTKEILDTFRKSGMSVNPKNALTVLYTTLKRNHRFERVAGKAWGLSEWYPDKRKKKDMPMEWETLPKKQVEY